MKTDPNHPINHIPYTGISLCDRDIGLTKRELFAAMALQGLCTIHSFASVQEVAEEAVRSADALIEALNKEQK